MPADPTQPVDLRHDPDPAREKPLVLVADDDATMCAMARRILEGAGYDVVDVASGRDALMRLRAGMRPDFLVTDLKMADGSGGWLVSQVGYEFPVLLSRTVVITGDAKGAAAAHVSTRWRCPVLAKPFTGEELIGALKALP
jgi:two-component system chemotaxis response regulator CheY